MARADSLCLAATSNWTAPDGTVQPPGTVVNRVAWDGVSNYAAPSGMQFVPDNGQALYKEIGVRNPKPFVQSGTVLTDASGNASWVFPTAFENLPVCTPEVISADTSKQFGAWLTAAPTRTGVSVRAGAANNQLNVLGLGALTAFAPPPTGTPIQITATSATG